MGLLDEFGKSNAKAQTLIARKEGKLLDLFGVQPSAEIGTVDRLTDADSPMFRGVGNEDRIEGYDAYEVRHSDKVSKDYFNSLLGQKKLQRQKEVYAQNYGIPVENVTNDMIFNEGMDQTYKALNVLNKDSQGKQQKDLILSTIRPDGTGNIFGMDKPLGLQAQRTVKGKDYYGRDLTSVANMQGKTLTETFDTPTSNTDYAREHQKSLTPSQRILQTYGEPEKKSGILNTLGASGSRVASKVERAGGDILISIAKAQADYDAKHPPKDPNAIGANWGKSFSDGLRKAGDALKNDATYNEILAEQYYNPSHAGSKMAGDVWQDLKKGNVIDAANKVTGTGTLDLIAESLPEMSMYFHPATFSALYAGNISEARKEYQEQNPGQDVSNARLGAMMIGEAVSMGLEKFAIGKMIGPTEIAAKGNEVLSKLAGKVAPAVLVEASKYVGKKAGSIAEAALAEGAQEVVQEGQRVLTTQYGTGKDIMTEENLDRLGTAFVGGGIAGGGIRTGVELPSIAGGVMRGADTALTMASEVSTGRTAEEVLASKQAKEAERVNMIREIDSRRVPITDAMTQEQVNAADKINAMLDYAVEAYSANTTDIRSDLKLADQVREKYGFTTPTPTDTATGQEATAEPMVEDTTNQSKVQYDEDVKDKAETAGFINTLTRSDKVKEIKVESLHRDGTRVADASKKKSRLVSMFNVDDDVISDIMAGNMNEDVASTLTNTKGDDIVNFAKRIGKKLSPDNTEVFQALRGIGDKVSKAVAENENVKTAMDNLFGGKASNERAVRVAALVLDTVHSAMRSEYDINDRYKLGNEKVAGARRQDVAHQLGKELVNSYELRLAGDPKEMAKAYIEIGENMLTIAENAGLIEADVGNVALHNMVDAEGNRLSDAKAKEYYPSVKKGTVQVPTVRVTGIKSTSRGASTNEVSAANAMAKLLKPINYELPTQDTVDNVPTQSDISDAHEEIIKEYNKMKYSIKPEALQLLKEVKEYIAKKYNGETDKALASDRMLINLLGLQKSDAGVRKNTEGGKSIGRKGTIINLLDNLEYLEEGDLHFNYESAINQRIHVMQTILDFQGDKYMARQILQGGSTPKKASGRARKLLLNTVAEELGMEVSEVENPTNRTMIAAMNTLDKTGSIPMNEIVRISKELKIKTPFKALSLIKVMSDIRKANGGPVTTSYQVESDATASGVVNTLLNLSGHPAVQAILGVLGIGTVDSKGTDPYNFIASVLSKHTMYEDKIKPILDDLKTVGIDARNVAKYPIMKWFYGQLDANNNADMGMDIANDLVDKAIYESNQEAINVINKALGRDTYVVDTEGKDGKTPIYEITPADEGRVAQYFSENLAEYYTEALNMQFAEVGGYRNKMGKIYKMLRKTGKWNGTIRTAMDALLPVDKPYKMSVKKLKQMVFTDDNTTYTTNKLMDNETSFNVNLQHATDAALLLMSIRDILGDVIDSGVMTVHDALYSDAETALKIMDRYNHYTKEAALKYDYMDAALEELNDALQKMDANDPVRKQYEATYAEMKKENDELRKAKEAYLGGKELNILGDWEVGNELAKERSKNTPEVKTTVVQANEKAKATVQSTLSAMTVLAKEGLKGTDIEAFINLMKNLPNLRTESKELIEKIENALGRGVKVKTGEKWEGGSNIVVIPSEVSLTIRGKKSGDTIKLDSNALVEVLAHEIDHAVQLQYIKANMNSNEIKYLQRVLQAITAKSDKLSPAAKARLDYINSQKEDYLKMAELSAILGNEIDVRNDMLSQMSNTVVEKVIEIINKIAKGVKDFFKTGDPEALDINVEYTMMAIQELNDNAILNTAKANNTDTEVTGILNQKDVHSKEYLNPYTAVNEGIAKTNRFASDWLIIWGSVMEDAIGAPMAKYHHKMKREYALYKSAVNLLRSGFYDSDFAQRMHHILGMANDVKDTVIKSALSLATAYQQESQKELEAMAEMDRQIKAKYDKAERVVVHKLFANTAIANLIMMPEVKDALMNGTKSVEELLKEVGGNIDAATRSKLDEVAEYWTTGTTQSNAVNVRHADTARKEAYVYTTLKAISMIDGGEKLLTGMDSNLRNWMMSLALINKKLNDEINEKGRDYQGTIYSEDAQYHGMYDGHYSMDIHDKVYEYKAVTAAEMRRTENSSENEWIVIKEPKDGNLGLIARENLNAGYVTGVGLELNRYVNGVFIGEEQSRVVAEKLEKMTEAMREEYLSKNQMVQDGRRFRMLIDTKTKVEKLSMVENAAHSLYRTYIHNKELIQSEAVRRIMLEEGTRTIKTKNGMMELERVLRENDKKGVRGKMGERVEVEPFVSIDYSADELKGIKSFDELRKQYPMVAKYYKTPTGLSNFNDFNRKVSLVKRGVSDVLLGHKNFSVFGGTDNRTAAKWEQVFKKMVVLAKQKMIVTNPVKLVQDSITNAGILSMMDIGVVEIYEGYKDAFTAYKEFSKARSKLVDLTMKARMADATATMEPSEKNEKAKVWALKQLSSHEEMMKGMDFYDAFNAGFVQSYSTDMVTKEFDTISGIQKDIDNVIDKYTHDKKGNPNKLFDAIKWWQNTGMGMDEVFAAIGKSTRMKDTDTGTEMVELAERLKNKKNDKESVSRYISDIIGAPASEVVAYGSSYMVLSDALSKYVLAKHLMRRENPRSGERGKRRKYTKEEAYDKANETFIDYRTNMPHEIKALSDYGILMFPAYWMKVQKVIAGLLKYHPVSALGSYAVESAMGAGGMNVMSQAAPIKFAGYQDAINNPMNLIGPEAVFAIL